MSIVRVSFGDVINYFKFFDFRKNLKILLSAVGKMCIICALLQNARSYFYGNSTSSFFSCNPPSLQEYIFNSELKRLSASNFIEYCYKLHRN